jgi:hypothetical protein
VGSDVGGATIGGGRVQGAAQIGRARLEVVASAVTAEVNVKNKVLLRDVGVDVTVGGADVRAGNTPQRRVRVGAADVGGQAGAVVLPAPDLDVLLGPLDSVDATLGVGKGAGADVGVGLLLNRAAGARVLGGRVVDRVVTVGAQNATREHGGIGHQATCAAC